MADDIENLIQGFIDVAGSDSVDPRNVTGRTPLPQPIPSPEIPNIPGLPPVDPAQFEMPNGLNPSGTEMPAVSSTEDPLNIQDYLNNVQVNGLDIADDIFNPVKVQNVDVHDHNRQNQYYERYQDEELGFSPFRDNEELYNKHTSTWDDMQRATGAFTALAGLAVADAASWAYDADTETAKEFEKQMAIGTSTRGGVGGFVTNMYLNSGYTVGIMSEMIMEELAMAAGQAGFAALGVGTGGAGWAGNVALTGLMAKRFASGMGKVKHAFDAAGRLTKSLNNLKDVNKARQYLYNGAKSLGKAVNPFENTLDVWRNRNALRQMDGLAATGKVFGEVYRDVRNIRLAVGEGALEGGMLENKLNKEMFADFRKEHGRHPTDAEADKMRTTAREAGASVVKWNAPLILLSNKITFDGLTRGGFKNMGTELIKSASGKNIVFNPKKSLKEAYSVLESGVANRLKHIANPANMLKGGGTYLKANFAEGLQELGQETISGWQEDVHTSRYSGDITKGGYYDMLLTNMQKQISPTGLHTFASGFLMGGMVAPISATVGASLQGRKTANNLWMKYSDPQAYQTMIAERDSKLAEDVNKLNEFYYNPETYLGAELDNLVAQKGYGEGRKVAQETNNKRMYEDMNDGSLFEHVSTAIRYGRLDTMIERLEDMKNLSPEEMVEFANGRSAEKFTAGLDKSIARAKNIESRYDQMTRKYPNPFDPKSKKEGSEEQELEGQKFNAWEQSIKQAVYYGNTFDRALERQTSILSKAQESAGLKNTSYSDLNVLFDMSSAETELEILNNSIKTLEEGMKEFADPKAKKTLKEATAKRDALKAYQDAVTTAEGNRTGKEISNKEDLKAIEKSYMGYMDYITKKNKDHKNRDKFNNVLKEILDYRILENRSKVANDAVNVLLDPKNFINKFEREQEIARILMENKKGEIAQSLKMFRDVQDKNEMLSDLADAGMFFNPKELAELEKTGKVPTTFYYTAAKDDPHDQVVGTSEDYQKAVAILKYYMGLRDVSLHGIQITGMQKLNPYMLKSRAKTKNDKRSYEDLAEQFGFDPKSPSTKVALKDVLQAIQDSEYATLEEKALAEKLWNTAHDAETVTFSNTRTVAGEYNETEQSVVDPRFSSDDYEQGREGHPIEHIILKEEVGRKVQDHLKTDTEFKSQMTTLMEEAQEAFKSLKGQEIIEFGHMIPSTSKEGVGNVEEFAKLAMTNPAFQQFLAGVKTELETKKSTWEKFVDLVMKGMEAILGKAPSGSVLNGVLDLVTARIDGVGPATATTTPTTTTASRASSTMSMSDLKNNHEDLATVLRDEFLLSYEARGSKFTPEKEGQDPLDSAAFKKWFADKGETRKENIIEAYNEEKFGPKIPEAAPKKTVITPEIEAAQNPAKTPSIVTSVMENALVALGYSDIEIDNLKMGSPAYAQSLIDSATTAEQLKAEQSGEKEKTEQEKRQEEMKQTITDLKMSIVDYDSWLEAVEKISLLLETDPDLVQQSGYVPAELEQDLADAKKALMGRVEFDELDLNEYVIMNDKYESIAQIILKTDKGVTIKYMNSTLPNKIVPADKVDEEIKFVSNETLKDQYDAQPEVEITEAEKEHGKESVNNATDVNSAERAKANIEAAKNKSEEEVNNDAAEAFLNDCK